MSREKKPGWLQDFPHAVPKGVRRTVPLTRCAATYLIGTGQFHTMILRDEDVSTEYGDDYSRRHDVSHLDAVVMRLGRHTDDEDAVEYRRDETHRHRDHV